MVDVKFVSPRGRTMAEMLAQVSNPTLPKATRWAIAESLRWELGEGMTTRDAGRLAEQTRITLGWSSHGPRAAQEIRDGFEPHGAKPSHYDWLAAAGFIDEHGRENVPDRARPEPGAQRRVAELMAQFYRSCGMPRVTAHETADERKPYVDD
jgi:hypothetical protein